MNSFDLTYTISKPVESVWESFFTKINSWWTSDFYTNPKTKRFVIETVLGGKMYEDFGNGEGLVWGEVIGVDKPNVLQVRGMLSGEFGGPALSYEKFIFKAENDKTILTYTAEYMGDVDEKTMNSLKTGWITIFKDYFIPFCES